jgi:hypothetical protein
MATTKKQRGYAEPSKADKPSTFGFQPYTPPIITKLNERRGGPSTPASSLLHRLNKNQVDADIIAVAAWAVSFFQAKPALSSLWGPVKGAERISGPKLAEKIEAEFLDDLGLEWKKEPMGGYCLQPKAEFITK